MKALSKDEKDRTVLLALLMLGTQRVSTCRHLKSDVT